MSAAAFVVLMMMQENQRRMYEEQRSWEENRRRMMEEEENRRQEEHRKMIEYRKNSPVVFNDEAWQRDRCVKATSIQPSVRRLTSLIEEVRPKVVRDEEQKYDEKLREIGYKYELLKKELDNDIETLRKSGITIEGKKYELSRLTPTDTNITQPIQTTESFGNTFTVRDGQPIELNPKIISSEGYYEDKYREMNPELIEKERVLTNSKLEKYRKYGKYLKFLLNSKKYTRLEEYSEELKERYDECELRKKEMNSFQSLSKEQLMAIKSYFVHLDKLVKVSSKIKELFQEKDSLRDDDNETIYDLTIKDIISNEEYSELVSQVYDYIDRICSNDEETMNQAYELVKGEYPIDISKRFIYDLILYNRDNYTKEDSKILKRSNR